VTALDLLQQAQPTQLRAPWCVKGAPDYLSALIENGDVAAAAALLDSYADKRGLTIVEVCRVRQGNREAAYARGEPKANPT
jgi:DNA-binding phage protein